MRPGRYALIDPERGVVKEARAVPGDREANERIQAELRKGAGEGCYVDFRPDE